MGGLGVGLGLGLGLGDSWKRDETFFHEELMGGLGCLRADEGNEEHKSDNLHEALGGLGEAEEFHDNGVPEELTDKGKNDETNDERKNYGETICVYFLLLSGGRIGETFYGHTGGGGNWGVHFSTMG